MKKRGIMIAMLIGTMALSSIMAGCGTNTSNTQFSAEAESGDSADSTQRKISLLDTSDMFTKRDLDASYDESECTAITLEDENSSCDSDAVTIDGQTVTITSEGTYLISGTLSNGSIVVDVEDSEKVQLVFDNVSITNESGAAVYVREADKVFLMLAEGSENAVVSNGTTTEDDSNIDGAIFAKGDLTINGTGTLTVTSAAHGIVCKDDLVVTGGTYNISAEKQGLSGKDSVRIADGTFDITSGGDAIHSENADDETKGFVYVANGSFTLNADGDGISASYAVQLDDGTITISQCYEGLEGQTIDISGGVIDITASDDGLNAAGGNDSSNSNGPGGGDVFSADEDACINISGGEINIDATGDGIDSNGDLDVSGGTILVTGSANGGNSALDYNGTATITGGTVVAAGMSGMAQNFGADSSQGCMLINLRDIQSGEITLTDADGKELISFTPSREYNSVVISCADLEEGATYTLNTGETATEVTLSSLVYSNGQSQSGQPGGMQNGQMPDQNGQSDSNAPSGQPGDGTDPG
ncbi:carbohydrate-binding domain-containing protein [uncultured Eubacterium sp.]|uniref:carbohydrate-binding domain-containing protein n=1 Tax=uncultured Eubacterium sp. TaxID=165185 RepID=UPI0025F692C6|nr:carbohydrate-binding domain-containing protein [uncultured Eubacterium sp.]